MDTRSSPTFLPCLYFINNLAIAADDTPATEEIIVEADRSRINLKLQIDQAENEFYAILNELIDDEEFKIECRTQRVIGSLVHKRICQTKYMKDELTNSAQLYQVSVNYLADEVLKKKKPNCAKKPLNCLRPIPNSCGPPEN